MAGNSQRDMEIEIERQGYRQKDRGEDIERQIEECQIVRNDGEIEMGRGEEKNRGNR